MKTKIVFWIPFNRAGFQNDTDQEWIKNRFDLMKKTALMSILNQSYPDFICLICCNKDTKHIIDPLMETIYDKRAVAQYQDTDEARARIKSISKSADEIITVRLDSDDMYHKEVAQELVAAPKSDWYIWKQGFGLRYSSAHMFGYNTGGSGPFFAHHYTAEEFGKKTWMCEPSHVEIKNYNPVVMPEDRFIVGVTGMNTTTNLRSGCFKKKLFEPRKSEILKGFGIYDKRNIV